MVASDLWLDCTTARILSLDNDMGGDDKDCNDEDNDDTGDGGGCNDSRLVLILAGSLFYGTVSFRKKTRVLKYW